MDEKTFDHIADAELRDLERRLGDYDPDELDVELSSGVLTLTLGSGEKLVVNSHRAAGQIWMAAWMAAHRQAWHFSPREDAEGLSGYRWHTEKEELRSTVSRILTEKMGRAVPV